MADLGSIAYNARGGVSARDASGWFIGKVALNVSAVFNRPYITPAKWWFAPFQKTIDGGQLSYTVTLSAGGTPVEGASVAIYERESRQLVAVQKTDASGYVVFGDLNKNYKYTAVAIHPGTMITYNAGRQDGMTPV